MTESKLRTKIKKTLKKQVGGMWKVIHGGPFQEAGMPDLIGLVNSKFFGIEVKLPGKENTLTGLQQDTLDSINNNGGYATMSTSVKHSLKFVRSKLKDGR